MQLISLDKLASMANDESSAVRQLVATVLSSNAEPKWTDTLIKLAVALRVEPDDLLDGIVWQPGTVSPGRFESS